MGYGYSRSPMMLKGVLVQFSAPLIVPIPNFIVFQFNPESISRTLSPYDPRYAERTAGYDDAALGKNDTKLIPADAQPFDPTETFTLNLLVDASDALEDPGKHPVAVATGVADRLAAMEMLLYPAGDSLVGGLLGSAAQSLSTSEFGAGSIVSSKPPEPRKTVSTVLFIWGPGRIVPVRLTSFTVEEVQFNQFLYPHRARVSLGMRVVTSSELRSIKPGKLEYDIAAVAYDFTRGQKEVLALASIANTVESVFFP
jgi:hypothetical protein